MADDVAVHDAYGSVRSVAAYEDPAAPGRVTQRQLVQTMVDGDPVDVSPAAPLPVTGALTNSDLRASPVPVDTELPAAAVPTNADINSAIPAAVARIQGYNGASERWRMMESARADGSAILPANVLATAPHLYDATGAVARPWRTARSLDDSQDGQQFPGAGQMLYNGTTWERMRTASVETVMALQDRAGVVGTNPGGTFASPVITTRTPRILVLLRVQSAPLDVGTESYLTVKIVGVLPSSGGVALLVQRNDLRITGSGFYTYALGPGVGAGPVGAGALAHGTAPAALVTSPEVPIVAASTPVPRQIVAQVWHRGTANGGTWRYSVDVCHCA